MPLILSYLHSCTTLGQTYSCTALGQPYSCTTLGQPYSCIALSQPYSSVTLGQPYSSVTFLLIQVLFGMWSVLRKRITNTLEARRPWNEFCWILIIWTNWRSGTRSCQFSGRSYFSALPLPLLQYKL